MNIPKPKIQLCTRLSVGELKQAEAAYRARKGRQARSLSVLAKDALTLSIAIYQSEESKKHQESPEEHHAAAAAQTLAEFERWESKIAVNLPEPSLETYNSLIQPKLSLLNPAQQARHNVRMHYIKLLNERRELTNAGKLTHSQQTAINAIDQLAETDFYHSKIFISGSFSEIDQEVKRLLTDKELN